MIRVLLAVEDSDFRKTLAFALESELGAEVSTFDHLGIPLIRRSKSTYSVSFIFFERISFCALGAKNSFGC
jgi:hypothetical protein